MNYRNFGVTGIRVSELGFGCGSVGGLFVRGSSDEMIEAVERALEVGINYFDTASIYGNGLSESNLGTTLRSVGARAKGVIVGTKVRLTTHQMTRIYDAIIESVNLSLQRLQMDSIDLIQLYNPLTLHQNLERNSLRARMHSPSCEIKEKLSCLALMASAKQKHYFKLFK